MDVGDQDVVGLRQFRIVADGIGIEHAVSKLEHNACVVHRRDLQIAIFRFEHVRSGRLERRRRGLRTTSLTATTAAGIATTTAFRAARAAATTVTAAAVRLLSKTKN